MAQSLPITCPVTWIEIHREAFFHNYRTLEQLVQPTKILPVMKADAYGLGLAHFVPLLQELGSSWLAVNHVDEALKAQKLGFTGTILIIGPVLAQHLEVVTPGIHITMANRSVLERWLTMTSPPPCHIKVDTGMHRQGFFADELEAVMAKIKRASLLHQVVGVMSHLSNDTREGLTSLHEQSQAFSVARSAFADLPHPPLVHLSASHGTFLSQKTHFDAVRLGISLLGFAPYRTTFHDALPEYQPALESLSSVLSWKARIVQIKFLDQGSPVGYEGQYVCEHDQLVALIGVGYFDGYQVLANHSDAHVICNGHKCPVIGKVSMNMTTICLPQSLGNPSNNVSSKGKAEIKEGDEVTLLGNDGGLSITLEDLAKWSGRHCYETLTALHPHMPRYLR